ncbi:MAG: hypothetical protein OEM59_22160 [Rhodospirillales bacterium]|nr:hypothetical protein [Rhodospirillales bacterium]
MFSLACGDFVLHCQNDGLPDLLSEFLARAQLAETIDLDSNERSVAFLSVRRGAEWPFLVVAQHYYPAGYGFYPGALQIPETELLFLGAGSRLLAFDLSRPARLWEDSADLGFWSWSRHSDTVLMAAELELAAWNIQGRKLWSTFVEPPWHYRVTDGRVELDVMGKLTSFNLTSGP